MNFSHVNFGANPNANTPPTWSFPGAQQGTTAPFTPTRATGPPHPTASTPSVSSAGATYLFGQGVASNTPPQQPTFSPFGLQQRFNKSVADGVKVASVSGNAGTRLEDTTCILDGRVDVLRVYLPLEALPLDWLDMLLYHFGRKYQSYIREIQIYIRSRMRPCLQDIEDNASLAQALPAMVENWASLNTTVKFFFHRLDAVVQGDRDRKQNFHEKDLITAIEALPERGVALTDILGDESQANALPDVVRSIEIEVDDVYL